MKFILSQMQENKKNIMNGVQVEFYSKNNSKMTKVTDKVTDNQALIIKEIRKNPGITTQELAEIVGISQRKIKENMAKLKDMKQIDRIGSTKTGYWKILNQNK
jgi:predicted HTH transcriptional regulator